METERSNPANSENVWLDGRSQSSNNVIVQMERYLAHYVSRKEKEGVPIDGRHIRSQARVFYATCLKKWNVKEKKPIKAFDSEEEEEENVSGTTAAPAINTEQ